ncbi:MAG: insulinase family protein [Halioglobus sp.]
MFELKSSLMARALLGTLAVALCGSLLAACAGVGGGGVSQPVQSQNDDYEYRLLTLDNQMQVLLISDPDAPKAAASLSVNVGSGDNPPEREGLAHFLEHMLFLGTEKYPDAAEYEEFITEHGGNRNAYTSFQETNYFFDINAPHLPEALDRFAQFFIAPKFDSQYVDREKNAVQAEYQMGLKSDGRRGLDVMQEVMNPEHPFNQFSVGSLETLADRPDATVRDDMLKFYAKHYSANAMRLAVLGTQSLDDLESLVRPMFEPVPNRGFEHAPVDAPIFLEDELPMLVQVKPLATRRQLEVFFPIDDYRENYRENPLSFLGNLLGHEGNGSLLSQLKTEGLAEQLGAGPALGWRGGALFSVSIALTEKGVKDYERVLQLLFMYTDMLRREGPTKRLYDEQARLADLQFRYREPSSPIGYVSRLTSGMHNYDGEDVLQGPYLMERYDERLLRGLFDSLRPDNVVVMLDDASVETDTVSDKYEVSYSKSSLMLGQLAARADDPALEAMHLPAPNEFIAEDVSLVDLPDDVPSIPQLLLDSPSQKIWFMSDDEFRVPKGFTYIDFRTPALGQTPRQSAMASLYTSLLMDKVNEFAYPARLAGLGFSFGKSAKGMTLRLSGYTDKQSLLLARLLSDIRDPQFKQQRFENIRQDMIRGLKNTVAKRPSSQLMDDLGEALTHGRFNEAQLIAELENAQLKDLNRYIEDFWQGASAQSLVYGNYTRDTVDQLGEVIEGVLPGGKVAAVRTRALVKLAAGETLQYAVDIPHDDSVVAWYLQGAGKSWKDRAATSLTAQIMTSGFFQQLRTEQQLGYVVSAFAWTKQEVPGVVMLVQSPVADAPSVTEAMSTFLNAVDGELNEAQFERHKAALISDISKPDKNLGERATFYWRSIARNRLDFASRLELEAAVEALTLDDWQAYFRTVFIDEPRTLQVISAGSRGKLPQVSGRRFDSATAVKEATEAYEL